MQNARRTRPGRRPGWSSRRAAVALLAGLTVLPAPAAAARYAEGELVELKGVVTGGDGLPIPDLRVVLEASRKAFSIKRLGKTRRNETRLATTTNPRGEYSLSWPWNDYYNHFELVVGVPVRRAGGEEFEELERIDVSRRMLQGSPVVTALTVTDTEFVYSLRDFLATVDSEDERRVYEQMGRPDRVEAVEGTPGGARPGEESTWWYFASGKAYRFGDGKLLQVIPFDPVKPIR